MNTRERKSPVSAPLPVFEKLPVPSNGAAENSHPQLWEEWFRHASLAERTEMLALADRQGFLYSHQFPSVNGNGKSRVEPAVQLWQQLLEGKASELPPLPPVRLNADADWAVSRVLASPDVFLLQVPPEIDATPRLAELVRTVNGEGKRVLVLAKSLKSLDPLLAHIERSHRPFLLRYTPGEAQSWEGESQQILNRARFAQGEAEAVCQRRSVETHSWRSLEDLARQQEVQTVELKSLELRLRQITEASVRSGAELQTPLAELGQKLLEQTQALEVERTRITASLAENEQTLNKTRIEIETFRPACESLSAGRWWSLDYWRARRHPEMTEQYDALQRNVAEQTATLQQTRERLDSLASERASLESEAGVEEARLLQEEIARQRAALEESIREVTQSLNETGRKISEVRAGFQDVSFDADGAAAYAGWLARKERDEESCQFARTWAKFLENSAGQFVRQLPRYAQVAACEVATALRHADFADGSAPFDLLILLGAEECVDADLLKIVRKAKRWVMVGNTVASSRNGILSVSAFQRLWKHLSDAPAPYRWEFDDARWTCHFRSVDGAHASYLESESLADFPEIELRILALPKQRPVLAQVAFPQGMSIAEAKSFIYRELQELAVESIHGVPCWQETDDAVILHLCDPAHATDVAAPIAEGVHEELQAGTSHTSRLVFAKAAGWTCDKAQEWASKSLPRCERGRTLRLSQ